MNDCFWTLLIQSRRNNRKNRDVYRTIIGDVFRTQWNILDKAFCKNSCLYLTVDFFYKTLHITCLTGLWICLDKTKQDCNLCKFIFKLYFIFTLLPCRETLITNWKHMSFISNWFTLVPEYLSATIYLFKLIAAVKKLKGNYTVLFY